MEGVTENIVAAATYYVHIDEETHGGGLKFRPRFGPDTGCAAIIAGPPCPIQTGTGIVFSNTIPHRFRRMRGSGKGTVRRLFLNFFIVNPDVAVPRLPSSALPRETLDALLGAIAAPPGSVGSRLPGSSRDAVRDFVGLGQWGSMAEAKEFRQRVRTMLSEAKSGWGYVSGHAMKWQLASNL